MTLEKNEQLTKARNYGIDLLRIVAMFMVLFLHILGNGGILFELEPLSAHGITAWFFEIAAFSAINCYGIISGYVGISSRYKYSNFAVLWLQVAFYSVIITFVYHLRYPALVSSNDLIGSFFPVCNQKYWYVTAYAGLFIVIPLLNAAVHSLSKKQLKLTLAAMFISFSLLPSVFVKDIFMTGWGYGMLWLMFLYLIGAYAKLYGFFKSSKRLSAVIYFSCVIFSWGFKVWEEAASSAGKYADLASGAIAQYTSPPMLISGLCIFVFFSQLNIGKTAKKLIGIIAPCSFGVYIIHAHPLLWDRLITYRYAQYIEYNPFIMMLLVFLTAVCMFLVLAAIDFVRGMIFKLIKIKPLLQKAEDKLLKGLWQ